MMYERALSTDDGAGTQKELWLKDVVNKIYNHKENVNGDFVHGLIIGNSSREGKSFFETTHMHLVDMPPKKSKEELQAERENKVAQDFAQAAAKKKNVYNMSMRNQVMGRITRMYSHCRLRPEDRYVRFFAYATQTGDKLGKTAEERAIEDSSRNTAADETMLTLQENSVDRNLWAQLAPQSGIKAEFLTTNGPVCGEENFEFDMEKQNFGGHTPNKPESMYDQSPPVFVATMSRVKTKYDPLLLSDQCRGEGKVFVHPPSEWTEEYERAFQSLLQMQQAQESSCHLPLSHSNVEWAKTQIKSAFNAEEVVHSGKGFVFDTRPPPTRMEQYMKDVFGKLKDWYDKPKPRRTEGDGKTTLFVSYETLMDVERWSKEPQWWKTSIDGHGELTRWGYEANQDLRNNDLLFYTGKVLLPRFCNDGISETILKDVEVSLMLRARKIKEMGKYSMSAVFGFGNMDWAKQFDEWATLGRVPTKHWDKASNRERAHGLGLMMRMRGALLDEKQQKHIFERVALMRAREDNEADILALEKRIQRMQ
jgi:hypothetical protein